MFNFLRQSPTNVKRISPIETKELMEKNKNIKLLDVRTKEEYKSGHISGAVVLPNELINERNLSIIPDKEQTIIVYCQSGGRSSQAASKLSKLGYSNVYDLGGIMNWPYNIEK